MYFDETPDLPVGTFAPGAPTTLGDVFSATAEQGHKWDNDFKTSQALEDEYDSRIDQIEKATGVKLDNPLRVPRSVVPQPGQRFPGPAADPITKFDSGLADLAAKYPDKADIIGAENPPSKVVYARKRAAMEATSGIVARNQGEEPGSLDFIKHPLTSGAQMAGQMAGWFRMPTANNWSPFDSYSEPLTMGAASVLTGFAASKAMSLMEAMGRNALANAGAGVVMQGIMEPGIQAERKAMGLDYGYAEGAKDIVGAGIASGVMGGALDLGIRAPGRAMRALSGDKQIGGVFHGYEAPPKPASPAPIAVDPELLARAQAGDQEAMAEVARQTAPQPEPKLPEGLNRSTVKKALEGDLEALREVGEKTGLFEDPTFKGAYDTAELNGPFDAEADAALRAMGVDQGDRERNLAQALRAALDDDEHPPVNGLEAALEKAKPLAPEDGARLEAKYGPELEKLKAAVAATEPRLADYIQNAIDAGISEALPGIEATVKEIVKGENPETVAQAFAKLVQGEGADVGQAATVARIKAGVATVPEIARALRSGLQLDQATPITEPVRVARSLAKLSDDAYQMVESGEAQPDMAAMVADRVANPLDHANALRDLKKLGMQNPIVGARLLTHILPHEGGGANDVLLGVRRSGEDTSGTYAGDKLEDPLGSEAKKQTDRLARDLAPDIEQAKAEGPPGVMPPVTTEAALAQAESVRQAIADVAGITPPETKIETFSSIAELPAAMQKDVIEANGQAFADAFRRFQAAASEEARAQARSDLDAIAQGRGIEGVSHDGSIWIATYALNPKGKIAHELVHALVGVGKLTPGEVKILAERARKTGAFSQDREALYRSTLEGRGHNPEKVGELLDEEAAAHLIEARANGISFGPQVNFIIDRARKFLEMVGNALRLRGFRSADDVTTALFSGEIAKRQGKAGTGEAMFSMRDNNGEPGSMDRLRALYKEWRHKGEPSSVNVLPEDAVRALRETAKNSRIAGSESNSEVARFKIYLASRRQYDPLTPEWPDIAGDNIPGHFDPDYFNALMKQRGDPMFSIRGENRDLDELGYYSKLDEVLGLLRPTDTITAKTLEGKGVKASEMQARGIADLLSDGKGAKVSDLQGVAAKNPVVVKEAQYQNLAASEADFDDYAFDTFGMPYEELNASQQRRVRNAVTNNSSDYIKGSAKWNRPDLTIDYGNPTYKEVVLHLGDKRGDELRQLDREANDLIGMRDASKGEEFHKWETAWHRNRDKWDKIRKEMEASEFKSGHWPESNVFAHLRTQELNTADGKRVLNLDELQSDWGQKLRDGGARDEAKIAELRKRTKDIAADLFPDGQMILGRASEGFSQAEVRYAMLDRAKDGDQEARAWVTKLNSYDLVKAELRTAEAATPGHPLVNTTDQWTTTALKRLIKQAVDSGVDGISITPGRVQAERYNKTLRDVTAVRYNPERRNLYYQKAGNDKHWFSVASGVTPERLRDVIGKEAAEKLLNTPTTEVPNIGMAGTAPWHVMRFPEGMTLGGEGMKATYDVMYPRTLGKILNKMDPSIKPETRELWKSNGDKIKSGERQSIHELAHGEQFTTFPITDKVRQAIGEEGQPLFSLRDSDQETGTFDTTADGKMVGYRVVNLNDKGQIVSQADSRRVLEPSGEHTIPMYVTNDPGYAIDYYGHGAWGEPGEQRQALLKYEFDRSDILKGNPADKEPELSIRQGKLLSLREIRNEDDANQLRQKDQASEPNRGSLSLKGNEPLFSLRHSVEEDHVNPLNPEHLADMTQRASDLIHPYLHQPMGVNVERDAEGNIKFVTKAGQRYEITRDQQGAVMGLAPTHPAAAGPLIDMISERAKDYGYHIDADKAKMVVSEIPNIMAIAREGDPAVTAQAISNLISKVMGHGEEEHPVAGAIDHNPPTPLRQDLADLNRMNDVANVVGTCLL